MDDRLFQQDESLLDTGGGGGAVGNTADSQGWERETPNLLKRDTESFKERHRIF
jgi:hypothetical protein